MYSLCLPLILTDVWFMLAEPRMEAPAHQSIFELEEAFDLNGSEYYEDQRPSKGTDSEPKFEGDIIFGF